MGCRSSIKALQAGLLAMTWATPLWSQQAKPPLPYIGHPISVKTGMVRIPAIVRNGSGAPITDLTIHDFTILENGQPQKIAYFEHIQTTPELVKPTQTVQNEVSNTYEQTPRRLTIILLDLLNTSFVDQERAKRNIVKFLSDSIVATEPVALMTLGSSGITMIHDFTMDPGILARALKDVTGQRSLNETLEPAQLDTVRMRRNPMEEAALLREMEAEHNLIRTSGAMGIRLTLVSLRQFGEAFAGIPGRKSLIWATGGLPFPADDKHYMDAWMNGLTELYQQAWDALNRADIALYPLDVEGLINPSAHRIPGMVQQRNFIPPTSHTSVTEMEDFARMTGGRMCYVKTEVSGCFREAAADSSDYYLLGFYPEPDPKRTGWRKLTIRVERTDTKILARTSYFVGETRNATAGRNDDIQMGLSSPLDYTDLPLTVRWTGNTEISGKKKVGFQYQLTQGAVTVDEADGNHVSMEFAAAAVSPKGIIVAQFSKELEGRLAAPQAQSLKSGTAFLPGELELASGDYMVRFVMRDNLSGRMGSISTSLKVP
jgi:VWFA-related protein